MIKRTLCLIISIVTIFTCIPVAFAQGNETATSAYADDAVLYSDVTATADEEVTEPAGSENEPMQAVDPTMACLAALTKKFPAGKYWNHMGSGQNSPDTVTNKPCSSHRGCSWTEGACSCNSFDRSIQCMGYAHKVAYDITGVMPRTGFTKSTKLDVSALRVGDIIRFRSDGHSICVTGVSGSKISFTDCNWDYECGIRWGVMDVSYIKNRGFTYVLHLKGNDRQNTDLYFFNHIEDYAAPEVPKESEKWIMGNSNLNVRSSASASATKVGSIPAGETFYVTEKLHTDEYLWGKVICGYVTGWAVLNYAGYDSGTYIKPDLTELPAAFETHNLSFTWKEVDGATRYLFRLYDKDKKMIKQFNVYDGCTASVEVEADGKYYAKVYATNSHVSSWLISGSLKSFEVKRKNVKISAVSFAEPELSTAKSESLTLEVKVEPENYTEELQWSSSDESVLTVENGVVTPVSIGTAVVYCKNTDGKISGECTVTVKPDTLANIKTVTAETSVSAISFSWDAVEGAGGYDVYRYNPSTKKYVRIASVADTKYTDAALEIGKSYYYLVRAYVKAADGSRINGLTTKVKLATRPDKVTGLKQKSSSTGSVTLVWDKVQNATVYVVYKYNSTAKKYEKIKVIKEATYTLTTAPAEKAYYRVYAATKANGVYLYSKASDKAYTVEGPEKAVLTVSSKKSGTAELKWSAVDGVYYYYVYRYASSGWERIAILRSDSTSYTDKSAPKGKNCYYRIRTVAKKGGVTGYGLYSDKVSVKIKK